MQQPGFEEMAELAHSGKAYVTIPVSAGPREAYVGFAPLARILIAANVDRILRGTNWPHPNSDPRPPATTVTPLWRMDNGIVLNQLPLWAPDA